MGVKRDDYHEEPSSALDCCLQPATNSRCDIDLLPCIYRVNIGESPSDMPAFRAGGAPNEATKYANPTTKDDHSDYSPAAQPAPESPLHWASHVVHNASSPSARWGCRLLTTWNDRGWLDILRSAPANHGTHRTPRPVRGPLLTTDGERCRH